VLGDGTACSDDRIPGNNGSLEVRPERPAASEGVYHMRTILLLLLYNNYPPKLYCVVMMDVTCNIICVVHHNIIVQHNLKLTLYATSSSTNSSGVGGSFYPECVYYIIRTRRRRRSIDDTHTLTSVATLRSKGVPVYYIILLWVLLPVMYPSSVLRGLFGTILTRFQWKNVRC